jgi:hypothetical protein
MHKLRAGGMAKHAESPAGGTSGPPDILYQSVDNPKTPEIARVTPPSPDLTFP